MAYHGIGQFSIGKFSHAMANDHSSAVKAEPVEPAQIAAAAPATQGHSTSPAPAPTPDKKKSTSWEARAGIAVVVLVIIGYFGIPAIWLALNTVSTDDAYVNSHVTFTAPRVSGQVVKVLVDDNNRVRKGDLIVQLDPEPYEVTRNIRQAAVETASFADLVAARDQVRAIVAQARANRFKLQHAIEDVNNQVAQLRANVATWESRKATLVRA